MDTDPANAASIAQAHEVTADYLAWLTLHASLKKYGIPLWNSAEAVNYVVGTVARDPADGFIYIITTLSGINNSLQPHQQQANWARFGINSRANPSPNLSQYAFGIAAFTDVKGNVRWGLDHQGLPAGQVMQWEENWQEAAVTTSGRWSSALNGGILSAANADIGAGLVSPFYRIMKTTPDRTATNATFISHNFATFSFNVDTSLTVEVPMAMGTTGSNSIAGWFGIGNGEALTATRGLFVYRPSGGGNWLFFSAEVGIGSGVDTGIPPGANVFQSMKIVLLGANCSETGADRAHLLIDGQACAAIASPLSYGSGVDVLFGATQMVPAGTAAACAFGPIRYRQNIGRGNFF